MMRISCFKAGPYSTLRDYRAVCRIVLGSAALLAFPSVVAFAAGAVAIRVEGYIAPHCAIVGSGAALEAPLQVRDVGSPGRMTYRFVLNCNSPFTYRVEAQYGALTNLTAGAEPSGFTAAVPYDVAVHIPTDGVGIEDHCTGQSIQAGKVTCLFNSSGNDIALDSYARLIVKWNPDGRLLMAGRYVERLTISIGTPL